MSRGIINNMNISAWLKDATKQLKDTGIDSARLDAELIMAETLRKPRTYLHANLDEDIDPRRVDIAYARLDLRKDRVPLAYITGHKEFYGREFVVSPQVLIPRPESEDMIQLFLEASADDISSGATLIDVGTGSGCLGITAKLERPGITVILSDTSSQALDVATKNAELLKVDARVQEQDLLMGQVEPVDYILANLPYVDANWEVSPETRHEPRGALFAKNQGMALILEMIEQIPLCTSDGAWVFVEADPVQHQEIIDHAAKYDLIHQKTRHYCLSLRRVLTKS